MAIFGKIFEINKIISLLCSKDNANREQNKMNLFLFYAEVQLIFAFCKDR
ncbi:hypothetical protein HMPREF9446_03511 [Bacteroides fluxus YIT 12057]|uniref:Uncharacterized protein n=1 Tax=Bacteroides fluxus YIT 12057 TaxID=763034 RepID=F3PXL3_9BACE|nr:hypothetical protein HMPREF9446_03511 [Bacteroides fluxus YIT 12057]